MTPDERHRIRITVGNRWDAIVVLRAFGDRGSYMIERGGVCEIFVQSAEGEIAERLEAVQSRHGIDDISIEAAVDRPGSPLGLAVPA